MLSEWNKKLLRLLQSDLQSKLPDICARQNVVLPSRSDKYYTNLVSERFQRLAQIWKHGQPKLTHDGALESAEEVEERMTTQREITAKTQRHFSRRLYVRGMPRTKTHIFTTTPYQRFRSRLAIVERVIEVKAADQDKDGDLNIWRWLQDLLLRYQADGMSSDDTDMDGMGIIYQVKILVWRRNIDPYVQMIDDERTQSADIFAKSGTKSVTRVRSPDNPKSNRHAPPELPVTLFNSDWLKEVDDDYRQITLRVSKDDFPWIEFKPE